MGLMLKEGLLKENIDGEALKWAFDKMIKKEKRNEKNFNGNFGWCSRR